MPTIPITIRAENNGVEQVFNRTASAASAMGTAVKNSASGIAQSLKNAVADTEQLKGSLEGVRNAGAGLALASAGALRMAEGFAQAATEAEALGAKMETLLSAAGMSGASEQVRALGDEIAKVASGDNDTIAAELAQAIATGRTRGLVQYGIVIGETGKKAIEAAGEISEAARAQETTNQIMSAGAAAVSRLRENLSTSAQAMNEANHRMAELEEGIGEGSKNAKAAILTGILNPLMSIAEANPGLQEAAGHVLYIGASAGTAIGGILGLGAQVGLLTLAFPNLGAASLAAFTTMKAAAASTIPFLLGVAKALAVPFAILAAGAAVGIAGYEALRATGVLGKDQKSTAEILADTRKTLLGDPAADAAASMNAATSGAGTLPSGFTESVGGVMMEGDATSDGDASTSSDSKAAEKAAKQIERNTAQSIRAMDKSKKQREREAKAALKAQEKEDKYREKLADKLSDSRMEVALERLSASFDVDIARLESTKTEENSAAVELKIKQLEAARLIKEADLKASFSDSEAEGNGREIARIKADSLLARAGIAFSKASREESGTGSDFTRAMQRRASGGGGAIGGSMFGMASGNYGSGSFVGTDPRAMAAGIAAARNGVAAFGGFDGVRADISGGRQKTPSIKATVIEVLSEAFGKRNIQIALQLDEGGVSSGDNWR